MEGALLEVVGASPIPDTWKLAQERGWDHEELVGLVKSLANDGFVELDVISKKFFVLTAEAEGYISDGSPEIQLLRAVPEDGMPIAEAKKQSVGFSHCMKQKWLKKDGAMVRRSADPDTVEDQLVGLLRKLELGGGEVAALAPAESKILKSRKMAKLIVRKSFSLLKGTSWAPVRTRASADLTKEMVDTGSWQKAKFKPYNFNSLGQPVSGGYLHPLLKVRLEFRKILLGMGFEEMPTNKWVESSFWNFDSLFQPQQHPARDAHDTFFLKKPAECTLKSVPTKYIEMVQKTHEEGGFGSIGYRYDWSIGEAKKNILRTHTTAVSSQMLYKLANQPGGFQPRKYFSIDRVFRNETMDATHLAEFHQVEGLVADRNLSLGDLIGTIATFFEAIGMTQLRFKPAFNPYTEPSMEIFAFHPDLKKWIEIGNSGMFRPEMIRPMGLPDDVRVIAWGLALERPTMIKYRIKNIRELFGHKINLEKTKSAALARFP